MFGLDGIADAAFWFARPPDWVAARRWFADNKTASVIGATLSSSRLKLVGAGAKQSEIFLASRP